MRNHRDVEAVDGEDCNVSHQSESIEQTSESSTKKPSEKYRNLVAFFLLGLLNNVTYVLMNAGAGDIVPGNYAVIYLCNIFPSMLVKITGPYWFQYFTYRQRILMASISVALCYILVNHFETTWLRLFGVALGAVQGGLGEATLLAMSQFFTNPEQCLVFYSSGTGLAGPIGYFISLVISPLLILNSSSNALKNIFSTILGEIFVAMYFATFVFVLETPWIDQIRQASQEVIFKKTKMSTDASMSESFLSEPALEAPCLAGNIMPPPAEPPLGIAAQQPADDHASVQRVKSVADTFSAKERFMFICGLWPYMVPLFVVYLSEYACQSGVWTAFALPSTAAEAAERLKHKSHRDFAYKALNLTYQVGVFVSRSSGLLLQPTVATLWLMPILQCAFWGFFAADSVQHFWYGWTVLMPAFVVGLLGGAVYVNAFTLIDRNLSPEYRELALSATSFGVDAGILVGNVAGLVCQWCLFQANNISSETSGTCPG